jgi:osmotically inducible protein OsmC
MAVLAMETVSTTSGREGKATSADGKINLSLSPPGSHGPGTNPEQLFAAGWSACFGSAIAAAAASIAKIPLRLGDIKVTTTVSLHKDDSGFFLDAKLNGDLKGVEQAQAEQLVATAHTICPYSKAIRGNIEVQLQANGKKLTKLS